MITIRDVAQKAGVSASTASRAMRNSPLISRATCERVQRAARELSYTPNFTAHNLATQANNAVGIVFPVDKGDLHKNPFYIQLIEGINRVVNPQQIFVTVAIGNTIEELMRNIKMMVENSRITRFILLYSIADDPVLNYLQQQSVNYVLIGKPYRHANSIPYVDNDNISAGTDATLSLLRRGHRAIVFIYTSSEQLVQTDRLLGFHEAMRRHGLAGNDLLLDQEDDAANKIDRLLAGNPQLTAILASDDILAFRVQRILQHCAENRPIECMGFNDSLFAELADPPFSTVQIYPERLGRAAAELIVRQRERNQNELTEKIIVPHKIIERNKFRTCNQQA